VLCSKKSVIPLLYDVLQEEQIAQLQAFISAQCDYHRQAMDTLKSLLETLETKYTPSLFKLYSNKTLVEGNYFSAFQS
jgi:hypothetical protein